MLMLKVSDVMLSFVKKKKTFNNSNPYWDFKNAKALKQQLCPVNVKADFTDMLLVLKLYK